MNQRHSSARNKQLLWLLKINSYAFPPLVVMAFGTQLIDTLVYPGFLQKLIGLSPTVFLILVAFSYGILLFDRVLLSSKLTEEIQLTLRANTIILPFLLFIYVMLNQLEIGHFPNYVFSTFHIHLKLLERIVVLNFFLSLFHIVNSSNVALFTFVKKTGISNPFNKSIIGPVFFFISMLLLLSTQLAAVFGGVIDDTVLILRHPFSSFDERRMEKFGGPYFTYDFINRHSAAKSVIAVPPQFTWGIVGNIGFSRYFTYPRFLIHPEDFTPETMPAVDYYIIAESFSDATTGELKIWPPYSVPAAEIYMFKEKERVEEKIDRTVYDPTDPIFRGRWGIIKVAKP